MRSAIGIIVLLAAACGGDPLDPSTLTPTYTADIAPLYDDYCTACHAHHGVIKGGVELDTYLTATRTAVKSACTAVTRDLANEYATDLTRPGKGLCEGWEIDSMPTGAKSGMTRREQLVLLRWLETGTPE